MRKRGQLTLIVIFGIVIVGALIIFIISSDSFNLPGTSSSSKEIQQIEDTIEDCLQQQAINAIWLVGIQGGYVNTPEEYIESPFGNIAYGIKDKKTTLASIETMQKEIESHLDLVTEYCINPLEYKTTIEIKNPKSTITIKKDSVNAQVNVEILSQDNGTSQVIKKTFKQEVPIRLGEIHALATKIIDRQKIDLTTIPISFLSDIETQILFEYHDQSTIYYIIHDENSQVNDVVYNFLFAVELEEPQDE